MSKGIEKRFDDDDWLKQMAMLLVYTCFRNNTNLEDIHVNRITQDEMKELMTSAVDNVYTFLARSDDMTFYTIPRWNEPKINEDLLTRGLSEEGLKRRAEKEREFWNSFHPTSPRDES